MKDLRELNKFRDNDLEKICMKEFYMRSKAGVFTIKLKTGLIAQLICENLEDWEHVSVSSKERCLTWEEMCEVNDLCFDEEEVTMQLHPKKSEYVNIDPYTLHIWKSKKTPIPTPPKSLVI